MSPIQSSKVFIITTATVVASALLPAPPIVDLRIGVIDFITPSSGYQITQRYEVVVGLPVAGLKNPQREKFLRLARRWKKETAVKSVVEGIILNPSYQKIVGMGEKALPFIFEDMRKSKSYWAHALSSITEDDPVPAYANMAEVREAWLAWGVHNGYVSS